jgi:DNA-directed RNA polymerase subunit RPC12/RpoP
MVKEMMKKLDKKAVEYTVDLTSIEGDGSFECPKCGMSISPEDESEENYKIVNTKVLNDELSELVIACGKCGSKIRLTGFQQIIDA